MTTLEQHGHMTTWIHSHIWIYVCASLVLRVYVGNITFAVQINTHVDVYKLLASMCMCKCTFMHACWYMHMHESGFAFTYVYTCIHYICVFKHMNTYTHTFSMCTHMHKHTHTQECVCTTVFLYFTTTHIEDHMTIKHRCNEPERHEC